MSSMGGSPVGGGMPIGGGMPSLGGGNPFSGLLGGNSNPNKSGGEDSFNVDDLVKRIDAKIAELEEEERREQENSKVKDSKEEKIIDAMEEDVGNNPMYEEGTNSDAFFDDFFSDD